MSTLSLVSPPSLRCIGKIIPFALKFLATVPSFFFFFFVFFWELSSSIQHSHAESIRHSNPPRCKKGPRKDASTHVLLSITRCLKFWLYSPFFFSYWFALRSFEETMVTIGGRRWASLRAPIRNTDDWTTQCGNRASYRCSPIIISEQNEWLRRSANLSYKTRARRNGPTHETQKLRLREFEGKSAKFERFKKNEKRRKFIGRTDPQINFISLKVSS